MIPEGVLKKEIAYTGREVRTNLRIIRSPPKD